MKRVTTLLYGIISYVIFLVTFLYAIGFVGNFIVPKSVDSSALVDVSFPIVLNLLLLGVFGLQHSVMARPGFKRWWTKIIPESIERSTFVLFSSLALILLYWLWQPMPTVLWEVDSQIGEVVLWALFGLGWGIVLISTFLISHVHLFGLHQVYDNFKRREQWEPGFQITGFYKVIRHPIMAGFFLAFWATPTMTVGHLLFTVVSSAYIIVATFAFEERDLKKVFGKRYRDYLKQVPPFIPRPNRRAVQPINEMEEEIKNEESQLA